MAGTGRLVYGSNGMPECDASGVLLFDDTGRPKPPGPGPGPGLEMHEWRYDGHSNFSGSIGGWVISTAFPQTFVDFEYVGEFRALFFFASKPGIGTVIGHMLFQITVYDEDGGPHLKVFDDLVSFRSSLEPIVEPGVTVIDGEVFEGGGSGEIRMKRIDQ